MNARVDIALAAILLGVLAAACTDQSSVAPSAPALPASLTGGFSARLTCKVTVTTATMTCGPATVGATSGIRAGKSGINRDYVTVGGPGTYVELTSSNTVANGSYLTSDVTVTNFLAQPMNTPDGTTVDTGGVKVFFNSGPTVTSQTGSGGTVDLPLADGVQTFTASNQPFYKYNNGAILPSGASTAARTWTFAYTTGVLEFTFDCYVYTQTPPGLLGTIVSPLVFYVVNDGTPSITVYGADNNGNVFPIGTITGSSTVLDRPSGIAVNASGTIYVTNDSDNINYSSITVYLNGFTGDPAPVDTITGTNTGLADPFGIAIDGSDHLYVTNQIGPSVTIYPPGAHGNVPFTAKIQGNKTHLAFPGGIAVDGAGDIYVASDTVTVYAGAGLSGQVNLAPLQMIAGNKTHLSGPAGIAVDGAGNIYVTNGGSYSVTIYAAGANGNVAPIDSIAGTNTGLHLPEAIALDAAGNIYVANVLGGPDLAGSVTVYAAEPLGAGMLGNVMPIRTIQGSSMVLNSTGLNGPLGIAF